MISAANDKKDDRSSEDDETKIMRKGAKIMDKLEKVEKLREKTGVSYEDAKNALEACDYDLLDAIIYLEKLDKVKALRWRALPQARNRRHQQSSSRHSRHIQMTAIK